MLFCYSFKEKAVTAARGEAVFACPTHPRCIRGPVATRSSVSDRVLPMSSKGTCHPHLAFPFYEFIIWKIPGCT